MKSTLTAILILSGMIFAQKFAVSMGTGTYAGYDDYSPKHITAHYYMTFKEKFQLGFSAGVGMTSFKTETDYDDANMDDTENEVKITGMPIEAEFLYSHPLGDGTIKPFVGLGLGMYSYTREEDAENFDSEATALGLAQYVTCGTDFRLSEKFSLFVQLKKMGFAFMNVKDEIDHNNNNQDREETFDYLAKPGTQDLGISAGLKFEF